METVWTVLTLSGQFQHCPDWYERVRMVLILSRQFCPDGFKLSGRFSNCPDGFQTVRMVFKLSGCCHIIFKTKREMITQFDMLREIFTHFLYVAREVYAFFWHVAAKLIRALRPESFCAWKAAIRKVLGFCVSGGESQNFGVFLKKKKVFFLMPPLICSSRYYKPYWEFKVFHT